MVIKEERENVLDILTKTEEALGRNDVTILNELSNKIIHTASTVQDTDSILLAVIVYSLSKIIERRQYHQEKGWDKFYFKITEEIKRAKNLLEKNDQQQFLECLEKIRNSITSVSGDLRKNIEDVFRKAEINKASKIYEHGISLETTAKLLGITIWELAGYAGQKGELESKFTITENVKTRIKQTMEMFE